MAQERRGLFAYNEVIFQAYLSKTQHSLLAYYAMAFNWTNMEPSYHSQEKICRILDMSPSTYQTARDELEDLGWISTKLQFTPNSEKKSVHVWVHCGRDDSRRASKIEQARIKKASKEAQDILEDTEPLDFRGGRNPAEWKKYEKAKDNFERLHPELAKKPKFKNSTIPSGSQSKRIQFRKENP